MEIRDAAELGTSGARVGAGATVTPLHPVRRADGLVNVDLWVIEPGGRVDVHRHGEEHVIYVISGVVEVSGGGVTTSSAGEGAVIYIEPGEAHGLRNSGRAPARLIASTPLLVRSERGVAGGAALPSFWTGAALKPEDLVVEQQAERPAARLREPVAGQQEPSARLAQEEDTSVPDISGLMKRGSDLVGVQRPERKRPARPPVVEQEPEAAQEDVDGEGEEEAQSKLMELFVAFEGGTRDKPPGQGFGSYMVQAPGRKPVVKRVEFGDNFTPQQAEYAALVACVEYIIERLDATGRGPGQVQLDIRSDSSAVVNQLLRDEKPREAAARKRLEQAAEMLSRFADWRIEWHDKSESARLLGG